jgi:hypothetical protein
VTDFVEITPEPTAEEREAVLQVLGDWLEPSEPEAYASAWRRSGLPAEPDEL